MSAIYWFEIPVEDIERATAFYNTVLDADMKAMDLTESIGTVVAMIPDRGGVGGMLVQGKAQGYIPSQEGALLYLNVAEPLDGVLARVEEAGGNVLLPKTSLGEHGWTAWIADTEGNRVGLRATA
ncbi:MAG: VOC family protein [Candidatus Promineifilaceae bacterium]|nr:VOC family protein [Candidatus Promineifilaceae bacterium]